jgi:1-aminocyclopropane-1-carboxylate deaminase/D-cysteine desulfhydrase-like pyridoxal-dependent ACC family enzyme
VRVVPRVVANRRRVTSLARRAKHLLERLTRERLPSPRAHRLRIVHEEYGGAYGRETKSGREAGHRFAAWCGLSLDATYSAKALAAVFSAPSQGPTLFWLTFDPRVLAHL